MPSQECIEAAVRREFIRRMCAKGYEHVPADSCYPERIFKDGQEIVKYNEYNDMLFKPKNRETAYKLADIQKEVQEYVTAYIKAKATGAEHNQDYHLLLDFNRHVLAARESSSGSFMFVTWKKDYNGNGYELGHYFADFAAAKEDFALRVGLINENKHFTELEMKVIRAGLLASNDIDVETQCSLSGKEVAEVVVEKINAIIAPEIAEQQKQFEAEGEDYEPE